MSHDVKSWPITSVYEASKRPLALEETVHAMRKLLLDHLAMRASFHAERARFEMHPQTRHDLMAAIHARYGTETLLDATIGGEFKLHGVVVEGNPMLGLDAVRFFGDVSLGEIVRVTPSFDDEGKR